MINYMSNQWPLTIPSARFSLPRSAGYASRICDTITWYSCLVGSFLRKARYFISNTHTTTD